MGRPRLRLSKTKFGRLTPIAYDGEGYLWICRCECGHVIRVQSSDLERGHTQSCGCLREEGNQWKHGFAQRKSYNGFYSSWQKLISRVSKKYNNRYRYYALRGIKFDPRWSYFRLFYKDMFSSWFPQAVLHRKNIQGNYVKSNCKWLAKREHSLLHNRLRRKAHKNG